MDSAFCDRIAPLLRLDAVMLAVDSRTRREAASPPFCACEPCRACSPFRGATAPRRRGVQFAAGPARHSGLRALYPSVRADKWARCAFAPANATRESVPYLAKRLRPGQHSYVEVIFPGAERPVGLGQFHRIHRDPDGRVERLAGQCCHLLVREPVRRLVLACGSRGRFLFTDDRDRLSPGVWSIRLIVGAEDGDARTYEVEVSWGGDPAQSADDILASALSGLSVRRVA